jgi:hypothetical protein
VESISLDIGPYVVGEKPPPLEYQFLDSAGTALSLSGYTAEFHYRRSDSAGATVAAAVVSDAAAGKVTYTWSGTELSTPGEWWCEFWVGNGTNRYCSKRLEATVRAAVGAAPVI